MRNGNGVICFLMLWEGKNLGWDGMDWDWILLFMACLAD